MAKKQKLSECCNAPMIGRVQCENCGSDGKFTSATAIVRKIDSIINLIKPGEKAKETAGERFIDCGKYIKDTLEHTMPNGKKVKLMWQKEDAPEKLKNNGPAEEYCKNSRVGEFNDWRLPERVELETLLDLTKRNPAADPILNMKSEWYWTKTLYAGNTDLAWVVGFGDGDVHDDGKAGGFLVRPVRQY